jgi:hypothetical protein
MAADGKIGPTIGEVLKAGLVELQQAVSLAPPPTPAPKEPDMER